MGKWEHEKQAGKVNWSLKLRALVMPIERICNDGLQRLIADAKHCEKETGTNGRVLLIWQLCTG